MFEARAVVTRFGLMWGMIAVCVTALAGCGGSGGPTTYTVGANVSGLSGSGLTLHLSTGGNLAVRANGNSTFATPLASGYPYVSGTIYQISAAGTESVIETFEWADGVDTPQLEGVILSADGLLYGSATGVFQVGSPSFIYGVTTTGQLAFSEASSPAALVQASNGGIYGITVDGGAYGMGAVIAVNPYLGTALYSFGGYPGDASAPSVPLIEGKDGNFYGTSATGGSPSATCPEGCGTVFSISLAGIETILYSFGSSPGDGRGPSGALVQASDGNFYGTTASGGSTANGASANCTSTMGCGTVYRISPSGTETVLYSFGATPGDGTAPSGALLQASDGNLYGTTRIGGASGAGTVFKLALGAN